MVMEITAETIKSIYQRAAQVAMASSGKTTEPDTIELTEDGYIKASWTTYRWGDYDTESEYICPDQLTADLDVIIAERKRLEAERAEAARIALEEAKVKQAAIDLAKRKADYERLKKEFE